MGRLSADLTELKDAKLHIGRKVKRDGSYRDVHKF